MGYIISFSGSQGTGKSTSALRKNIDLNMCYPEKTIHLLQNLELKCPYEINQGASEYAQQWLFSNQMNQEMDNLAYFDIVVTDRTVVDVIAYTYALGFQSLAADMLACAQSHMYVYKKIYFKKIANNNFNFDNGIRDTDLKFRSDVEESMLIQYEHLLTGIHFHGEIYYV